MSETPQFVQPDSHNPYEKTLAGAFNVACNGQSIFMEGVDLLTAVEEQLNKGSLTKMRAEFVDCILKIGVPFLENHSVPIGANLSFARERLEAPKNLARLIRDSAYILQQTKKEQK